MKKLLFIFFMPLMLLSGCASPSPDPDLTTHQGIRRSCRDIGAYHTVRFMTRGDREAWYNFENQVAAGEEAWLQLVPVVLAGSDAGYRSGIIIALAEALPKNPEGVLALEGAMVSLKYVCSIPFIEPTDKFIDSYAASVEKALDGVADKYFEQDKRLCRLRLREALRLVEQRRKGEYHFK